MQPSREKFKESKRRPPPHRFLQYSHWNVVFRDLHSGRQHCPSTCSVCWGLLRVKVSWQQIRGERKIRAD